MIEKIIYICTIILALIACFFLFRRQILTIIKTKILLFLDLILWIKGFKFGFFLFGNGKLKFRFPSKVHINTIIRKIIDVFAIKNNSNYIEKTLIIIKLDAIGDYVLFHNFLNEIKNTPKYKDYKITLCGNQLWKDVTLSFKTNCDDFIWINKNKFSKDLAYRYKTLKIINKKKFEIAVNPHYSRDFLYYDSIIQATSAKERIGFECNLSNISEIEKFVSDKYYTNIINSNPKTLFEFYRNTEFFEKFLERKINLTKPSLFFENIPKFEIPFTDFAVIFPSASKLDKIWDAKNFFAVSKYLYEKYNLKTIICGGKGDEKYSTQILSYGFNEMFFDLTGKTDLVELTYILSKAKILISNDTSAVHFAVAVQTNTIYVLNGSHFGRFGPYPNGIAQNVISLYPDEITSNLSNFDFLCKEYEHLSPLDINSIKIKEVIRNIDKLLA